MGLNLDQPTPQVADGNIVDVLKLLDGRCCQVLSSGLLHEETYITNVFPHEPIVVNVAGKRVTGSPSAAIGRAWGYKVARKLFHSRKIVDRKYFRLIYWDGIETCMKQYPTMFRVWVTKHVSHFCGTNRQLSRIDPNVSNTCPSCGYPNEDTSHVRWIKSLNIRAQLSFLNNLVSNTFL